jgi:hypothetical protein
MNLKSEKELKEKIRHFAKLRQAKYKKLDEKLAASRQLSRRFSERIIILSSSMIVAIVSLYGVSTKNVSWDTLRVLWALYLLAGTIIVTGMIFFLEGKVEYARIYRSSKMTQEFEDRPSIVQYIFIWGVIFLSLLKPNNLIFCRRYNMGVKKLKYAKLNGYTVHYLARMTSLFTILEFCSVALFVAGLLCFISSVQLA